MNFRQKGFWLSGREYIIEQDGLKVISRSFIGTSKNFFDFHQIGNVVIRKRKRALVLLLPAVLFFACGSWLLLAYYIPGDYLMIDNQMNLAYGCIFWAFLNLVFFFLLDQKYLYLWSEEFATSIKFLDNVPSEKELDTFIMHVKKAQRIRLQQLYLTINENMSYEEHRKNIQWLRDNEFLSQKEAEQRLGVEFKV